MGKNKDKNRDEPNTSSIANRDILQRLNFLYQASVLLNGLSPLDAAPECPGPSTSPSTPTDERACEGAPSAKQSRRKKPRRAVSFGELSRSYVETMKSVGRKTNVRMDPSVKRRICKRCSAPLVPGISASVRVKESASHGHLIVYRCHACRTERRIPAPPVLEGVAEARPADADATRPPAGDSVRKRQKSGPRPRLPPHFARDVGHIVFRGNERLDGAPNPP